MQVLGLPLAIPQAIVRRSLRDLAALERTLREAPRQLDRALGLAEELVEIGHRVLIIAERLDGRAAAMEQLGERLELRADEILVVGGQMRAMGGQLDERGAEIVERAGRVVDAAADLVAVLPALERAIELATPLEGAIDRFGRLVDRFPGAPAPRRRGTLDQRPPSGVERLADDED